MPARTYATDVYLTCPCSECEGRGVRITLRKFRNLSASLAGLRPSRTRARVGKRVRDQVTMPSRSGRGHRFPFW
jgi:hypothetical protein